jgi:nucleoside-diphosphate-sugar epimerase
MTESMPLAATSVKGRVRAKMWQDALAAHEAGRVRATEARASDFIGPRSNSMFNERMLPALLAGKTVRVPIDFDQPHTVTYIKDVARTLVTLADDERAWGRAWHVPSAPATTYRTIANRAAELAGVAAPKLAGIPMAVVRMAGAFNPLIREYVEVSYQFLRPFVLDSSAAQQTFGLAPTPLDEAISAGLPAGVANA